MRSSFSLWHGSCHSMAGGEVMKGRTLISLVSLVVVSTVSVPAGVVPGKWQKVDALQPGTQIKVTLKAGDRIECIFNSSGPVDLTLTDAGRGEVKVPKSEVLKIVGSDGYNDSIGDGVAMGALIGVGLVLVSMAVEGNSRFSNAGEIALGAGMGAVVGLVVDTAHKGNELLYRAAP